MVDLPSVPLRVTTSEAPTSSVTPGQIAAPYQQLASALDKSGEAFGEISKDLAEQAGYKAVSRDADGNLQVDKAPIIGPAAAAYSRAVKFAALADGEGEAKWQDIALRQQHRDDPDGYLAAADAFRTRLVKTTSDAAGPDVGLALGKTVDATTTFTYRGLLNESERLGLQRADASMKSGISSARDDAMALARSGDTSSDAYNTAVAKVAQLTNERVNNPRLAYPPESADYDMQQFHGELSGNVFLHKTNDVYKDTSVDDKGQPNGGAAKALDFAQSILTDPSLKLTDQQREAYFHKATAEVHTNEALRRQDVSEARAAGSALTTASALGARVEPEDVEQVADAFRKAGAPGDAARLYATFARKPLNDDFGRQPLAVQTQQLNGLRGGTATSPAEQKLISFESGGNPTKVNQLGYAGLYQFGAPLLTDLGLYKPGANEDLKSWSKTSSNAPGKWSGTFSIPGFPDVKNVKDFLSNPDAQKAAFDTHTQNMDSAIDSSGMSRFEGQTVGGVPITRDGMRAMIHLGGAEGAQRTLESGGANNPRDANGTSLLDYARMGGQAGAPNPASSLWLSSNRSRTVKSEARLAWQTVMKDYDEKGTRPGDAVINNIVDAAHATNDHDLLETIGIGVDRIDLAQNMSRRSLPEQEAALGELKRQGSLGGLSPGQAGVQKDLQRKKDAIQTGLNDNPIQTTVSNFGDKFRTPGPLNLDDDQQLAAGLAYRGKIAQFASENWRTNPVSALDKADLTQVQAAIDTPDVAQKARIFSALSTLPEEVRNATLAKLGAKGPDAMVKASAGSMFHDAPDVALSILRGQEAIKTDKGYTPEGPEGKSYTEALNKALPVSTFTLAGRTDDTGPLAAAQGMVKARYADLSAQSNDASGKFNEPRLKTAVDDVTGGILTHNSGSLIAPRRGMSQNEFDGVMQSVTDNDLLGVTTMNGAPITAKYLQNSAQLESVADGRYFVRLGGDPLKPIYAYQNARDPWGQGPQKFVLDLRGRTAAPVDTPSGSTALAQ